MTESVALQALDFIAAVATETSMEKVSITFHGGEPLLAPKSLWECLLHGLPTRLPGRSISWSLQSNLWALDDAFCEIFRAHGVSVGTSLDGPKEICDLSRGKGYWERTMAGIALSRQHGLDVGAIATLTRETAPRWKEVVDFFIEQNLSMNLHPALKMLGKDESLHSLSATEYAQVLEEMLPYYLSQRKLISISTLDHFAKGCVHGDGEVCTFRDCFGMFLAIAPDGSIYSCQRFCGRPEFALGNVADKPSLSDLYSSTAGQRLQNREKDVASRCGECSEYGHCHGGCTYNAFASGDGVIDPLCDAYRKTFGRIRQQVVAEMAQPENIEAIAERPPREQEHPLLRKGPCISLTKRQHPKRIASHARTVLCLRSLGKTGDPALAAQAVVEDKICGDLAQTESIMRHHHERMLQPPRSRNNLYAHVTLGCNLRCTHCYAEASEGTRVMDPEFFSRLLEQTQHAGFRQFIVTGGEPLTHPASPILFAACKHKRGVGIKLVLRTNLAGTLSDDQLRTLAESFDLVVASVDGNEETHNARRGTNRYTELVNNLERYQAICKRVPGGGELSLACTMDSQSIQGEPGESVRLLAKRLGVKRTRFRPILPLGRASEWDEPLMCEGLLGHVSADELLEDGIQPLYSCGIGQNLFVEPGGDSFPCYAYRQPHTLLGNVASMGLQPVLDSHAFLELERCTVDTISKCKECDVRYLCGGACRAWGNEANQQSLNAAPPRCDHLRDRAVALLKASEKFLLEK